MGIAKSQFNNILGNIFTAGNTIQLFSTMPNENETGMVKISGASYAPYIIKSGDFSVNSGVVESKKNMMFYLCEESAGHGTAVGFGVYNSSGSLLYFGEFTDTMPITYNSVPTIKRYNGAGEGIRITMTSTEATASAE